MKMKLRKVYVILGTSLLGIGCIMVLFTYKGDKMSKSLGNIVTIEGLRKKWR